MNCFFTLFFKFVFDSYAYGLSIPVPIILKNCKSDVWLCEGRRVLFVFGCLVFVSEHYTYIFCLFLVGMGFLFRLVGFNSLNSSCI